LTIPPRRQASAIELGVLLRQIVVEPGAGEMEAVQSLAESIGVAPEIIQLELLHTRAFAVELALQISLSDDQVAMQLREQFAARIREGHHDSQASELLQQRLETFHAVIEDEHTTAGLAAAVGQCFAAHFAAGALAGDLAHLAGRLFAGLFDEVCDLLAEVELVEIDVDDLAE